MARIHAAGAGGGCARGRGAECVGMAVGGGGAVWVELVLQAGGGVDAFGGGYWLWER
jgi:hypothetical protein